MAQVRITPLVSPVFDLWKTTGKSLSLTVHGNSMRPLLRPGDRVTIRMAGPADVRRGDIVAFRQGEGIVVHRCVGWRTAGGSKWFCEKGDSQAAWRWVPEDHVAGRVESLERDGRARDMGRWPWSLLNRLLGSMWSFWIGACETRRAEGPDPFRDPPDGSVPVGMPRFVVKGVNRICRLALAVAVKMTGKPGVR